MPAPTSDETWQLFIDELRRTGLKTVAAAAAGIHIQTAKMRVLKDPEFAEAVKDAREEAAEVLEKEAWRRAVEGVTRQKVIGSGENALLIEEQQYSDPLLIKLLEGNNPEKFKTRTASEISGPGGQPVELNDTGSAARLAAILEDAKRRRDAAGEPDEPDPFS